MNKIYDDFLRELLDHNNNLSIYVDSLYENSDYSEDDLNHIFGVLKSEGLVTCQYADDRAWMVQITLEGLHYFDDEDNDIEEKPRLLELIEQMDTVENLFYMAGGNSLPQHFQIYDIQDFQDWIQELQYELREVLKTREDDFIRETLTLVSKKFDGWSDQKNFSVIKAKLKVIEKNGAKYFPLNIKKVQETFMEIPKKPLIFVSHSSQNKTEVGLLVEMFRAINLQPQQDIFCSSLPGYDIPINTKDRIFDFLRDSFLKYDIHIFFVHSHEYYRSPVSLNEMGAAWALKTNHTSVLLPGFEFEDMKGVINADRIAIKLDNDIIEVKDKLNQVRRQLEKEFNLSPVQDTIWEQARDRFIKSINHMETQENQFKKISKESQSLLEKVAVTIDGQILTPYNLAEGTSIQVGEEILCSEYSNRREYAKWDAALKECLTKNYIEKKAENFYVITNAGYRWVEEKLF